MPNLKLKGLLANRNGLFWLWISIDVILLDQIVKYFVVKSVGITQSIRILPFLNIILSYNTGSAFGFLNSQTGWQVYVISIVVVIISIILLVWLKRTPASAKWLCVSLSLIIGGAIGNLIDRLRLGYVVDFIDFHIRHWHFATFNIADAAVSIGAFMLIWHMLFLNKKQ